MQKISRRSLFGGVAAAAVAAIVPARGQTFMLRPAGANTGIVPTLHIFPDYPLMVGKLGPDGLLTFTPAPREVSSYDLKIAAGYTVADGGDGVLVWQPPRARTAADDYIDFGNSFEIDGERIPPEDWEEAYFYERDKLAEHWDSVREWFPPSGRMRSGRFL